MPLRIPDAPPMLDGLHSDRGSPPMLDRALPIVTIAAAVGCGLVGGLLFAFSAFVMQALDRLPARDATAAMQSINATILNPAFGLLFGGTAALCAGLLVTGLADVGRPGAVLRIVAAALLLVGVVGVTLACNVPLNDRLARVDPAAVDAVRAWGDYRSGWLPWNHVRTAAAAAAAILLTVAGRI